MEKIKVSNFRKVKDTWDLDLAPITFFTGKNNSGKSSILKALMVLSDFGNSRNHFELNFNGENKEEHKIKDYSNATNWNNGKKSNLELDFVRDGYAFSLIFKPKIEPIRERSDEDQFSKGELLLLQIRRIKDNALLEIVRNETGYQINLDDTYLAGNFSHSEKPDPEVEQLKEALAQLDIELNKVEKEIKGQLFKNPSLLKSLGVSSAAGIASATLGSILAGPLMLAGAGAATIFASIKGRELLALKKKAEGLQASKKSAQKKLSNLLEKKVTTTKEANILRPQFNLEDFSRTELAIDTILKRRVVPYLSTNEKKLGKSDKKKDTSIVFDFAENILKSLQFEVHHLSPNRNRQTRLYYNRNGSSDIVQLLEKYNEAPFLEDSKENSFLKYWLRQFEIGTNYRIKSISGQANTVEIFDKEENAEKKLESHGRWVDLVDKGFGAGQLFTILLQIAMASANTQDKESPLLLIEEPESNLHPKLQSKLAELFLDAYSTLGVRLVIETHSEYILRKTQSIYIKLTRSNPFAVYYFDEDGPYRLNYKADGSFDKNFGEGFFDVVDDIALEMFLENN